MTSALSITRSVAAPRAAFVDFPLGHTAGKPHRPELQRELMAEALAAFHELQSPAEIRFLSQRWSRDESWRQNPMANSASETERAGSDFRTPRRDTPQYQYSADRVEAENRHRSGGCGTCVGAE